MRAVNDVQAGKQGYPIKHLVAFDRTELRAGEEKTLRFVLGDEELRLVSPEVRYTILRGEWVLRVEEASVTFVLYSCLLNKYVKSTGLLISHL